jgi:hypothetical protein
VYSLLQDLECGRESILHHGKQEDYPFLSMHRHVNDTSGFHAKGGRQRIVIDIGLKDGQETVDSVKSGFLTYSFEAAPAHCKETYANLVKANLRVHQVKLLADGALAEPLPPPPEDGVTGMCYLFCAAAGAKHSWHTFFYHKYNGFGSSFHDKRGEQVKVQVVPVQDYIPLDAKVAFVKSDTQGHEVQVLMGMQSLFRTGRVRMLGVEFWPKGLFLAGSSPEKLLRLLGRYQMACFSHGEMPELHAQEGYGAVKEMQGLYEASVTRNRWGWFNDLVCMRPVNSMLRWNNV